MDIQVSSNFERLLFEAYGRDAAAVRALMASLAQSRRFSLSRRRRCREIRALFTADRADEDETAATIRTALRETGYLHRSAHRGRRCGRREGNARSGGADGRARRTAHPAKFPDAVEAACGVRPALAGLARRSRPNGRSASTVLPADQGAVEQFILAASRAAREGAAA